MPDNFNDRRWRDFVCPPCRCDHDHDRDRDRRYDRRDDRRDDRIDRHDRDRRY